MQGYQKRVAPAVFLIIIIMIIIIAVLVIIMIITMLMIMIMIMAIAIPMGIAMIMITLTLLLNEINIPFAAEASFLKVPTINGAQKNCLLFIFKIEVSIVFKII